MHETLPLLAIFLIFLALLSRASREVQERDLYKVVCIQERFC